MKHMVKGAIPYTKEGQKWPQILAIISASISGIGLGTLFSWTSPSIPILISNASHLEPITLEAASYFTVIPSIAAILSAPIIIIMVEKFGRKLTVLLISVPYIFGWLLIIFAKDLATFYVSRFLEGVGEAFFYGSIPMYVSEIAEPKVRGFWGNSPSLITFIGQFLINLVGGIYDIRTTACILISAPILQFLIGLFLPESPYFLIIKGRTDEARNSLQTLRWKEDVEDELKILVKDVNRQISESGTWKDLFTISTNNKALKIAIGIRTAQQFSGLPAFLLYTQYIFNQAGGDLSPTTSTLIFTGTLVILISLSSKMVDKLGRRSSMILSSFGCGIATGVEAIYFYIHQECNWDTKYLGWIPIGGMIFYIIACAAGLATLPTLMLGELFSASVKGKAVCIVNIFYSIGILTSSKLLQSLSANFGMYVPFCFYTICSFISVLFSYLYVPETKGKTLEEIQQGFLKRDNLCNCSM